MASDGTLVIILIFVLIVFVGLGIGIYFLVQYLEGGKNPPGNTTPKKGDKKPFAIRHIERSNHYLFADDGTCAFTHNTVESEEPCGQLNWLWNSDGTLSPAGFPNNYLTSDRDCISLGTRGLCLSNDKSKAEQWDINQNDNTICTTDKSCCINIFGGGVRNIATQCTDPSTIDSDFIWQTTEPLNNSSFDAKCTG